MSKKITVRVCPQCEGDCQRIPGGYNWQCSDCGWEGETTKTYSRDNPAGRKEGEIMLREKVI